MAIPDDDAVLIHRLFGPDAAATRAGHDPDVVQRIDDAAVEILAGRDLGALDEEEAERVSRVLAARIRSILREELVQLEAAATVLRAEGKQLGIEIDELQKEKDELLRRLEGDGSE